MPKEFYTEKDIEDLFKRGIKSLQITENVVLTELAYEKARRLDFQLISDDADNPPAAPVRPYLSEPPTRQTAHVKPIVAPVSPSVITQANPNPLNAGDVEKRIRSAVIARLGNQVDAKLLDNIIHRVVKGIGLK
ncbi:MAG TPA: hypothetical protein VF896_13765 [Anaerolineales bacterium]